MRSWREWGTCFVLAAAGLAVALGCRKAEPVRLDPVRALKAGVGVSFAPPADGILKAGQLDLYLKVRGRSRGESLADALAGFGADAAEFAWIRARVREALLALEADRVTAAVAESYARGVTALREARKSAKDPKTIARLDAEIATLERERATLRKANPAASAVSRNAVLVAPRRAEIEALGP